MLLTTQTSVLEMRGDKISLLLARARTQAPDNDFGPAQYRWFNAGQDVLESWYKNAHYPMGKADKIALTSAVPCQG